MVDARSAPSRRASAVESVTSRFDLIADTVPYVHDLNPCVLSLVTGGALVLVGYLGPLDDPALLTGPLVLPGRTVSGSLIGSIADTQEMLDFCGSHGIGADIEIIPTWRR